MQNFHTYPGAGGNIRCVSALTSCAVLDVLGPPYSDAEGQPCMYYRDFPYSSFAGDADSVSEDVRDGPEGYAWLEKRENPKDFVAVEAVYRGPKIVES